jgi:hypothetical protein
MYSIPAPDGGILLFSFYRKDGFQVFGMSFEPKKPAFIDSNAKSIFLVDDRRIVRPQSANSYIRFFTPIDGSDLVAMSGAQDLSMKVADVVFEFTTAHFDEIGRARGKKPH